MAKTKKSRKKSTSKAAPELSEVDLPALVSMSLESMEAEERDRHFDVDPPRVYDDIETELEIEPIESPAWLRRTPLSTDEDAFVRAHRPDQPEHDYIEIGPLRFPRLSRWLPSHWLPSRALAPTIGVSAAGGALLGSLATLAVVGLHPSAISGLSVAGDLTQKEVRIDAEFAALRANFDPSTARKEPSLRGEEHLAEPDRPGDVAGNDITGSTSDHQAELSAAALQPTIEGWTLRNVYGGAAVVEGQPGLIQVMPGDSLPGVGRIESIRRQDGRWVVVTSRGLIVTR
jgi:hypothetical protein